MGLELDRDRQEIIDQPERPLFLSTVKNWVIEALERRYEFLCQLDSAIKKMKPNGKQGTARKLKQRRP